MTNHEYKVIKSIILACSTAMKDEESGRILPYADTDRVIAALDTIFAGEVGISHEIPLREQWRELDTALADATDQPRRTTHFLPIIIKGV